MSFLSSLNSLTQESFIDAQKQLHEVMLLTLANLFVMALSCSLAILLSWPPVPFILNIVITITLLFTLSSKLKAAVENNDTSNLRLFYFGLFSWIGYRVYPFIYSFILVVPNGALLMTIAAISTIVLTATLALFSYLEFRNNNIATYNLARPIISSLVIGIIAIGLLNFFLHIPALLLLKGIGGAFLFSIFLMSDITSYLATNQNITDTNSKEAHKIVASGAIALDIINIFISILEIFAACKDDKSRASISNSIGRIFTLFIGPLIALGAILGINTIFNKRSSEVTPTSSTGNIGSGNFASRGQNQGSFSGTYNVLGRGPNNQAVNSSNGVNQTL